MAGKELRSAVGSDNPTHFRVLMHETVRLLYLRNIQATSGKQHLYPSFSPSLLYKEAVEATCTRGYDLHREALDTERALRRKWGSSFRSSETEGPVAKWKKAWEATEFLNHMPKDMSKITCSPSGGWCGMCCGGWGDVTVDGGAAGPMDQVNIGR